MRNGSFRTWNGSSECHIQIIVDDTIATLYVEGVALNTRMYAKAGQALALYVVDGTLTLENAVLQIGLK
jgi:beta-fructofuranosidase